MRTGGEGTGKTFDISYALTYEEIQLFARVWGQKQDSIARLGNYSIWIAIAGVAVSFLGGAIAQGYYGVPLDSRSTALVMALFSAFYAGAIMYHRLGMVWSRRISARRIAILKKVASVQMNKDGITLSKAKMKWHAAWEAIEDINYCSGAVIFWSNADTGLLVPLRALHAPEEQQAFIDALKAWWQAPRG